MGRNTNNQFSNLESGRRVLRNQIPQIRKQTKIASLRNGGSAIFALVYYTINSHRRPLIWRCCFFCFLSSLACCLNWAGAAKTTQIKASLRNTCSANLLTRILYNVPHWKPLIWPCCFFCFFSSLACRLDLAGPADAAAASVCLLDLLKAPRLGKNLDQSHLVW